LFGNEFSGNGVLSERNFGTERKMIARRKYSADAIGRSTPEEALVIQAHLAHIASLREARMHHRAITLELRSYFDSVAAETVPDGFRNLLTEGAGEECA
jgi:hypothetical protein